VQYYIALDYKMSVATGTMCVVQKATTRSDVGVRS